VALRPTFHPCFSAVRQRSHAYWQVLEALAARPGLPREGLAGVLARAALLFNSGLFFEVHEVLEEAWHPAEGDARLLLQGLVQTAAALHHYGMGNYRGARALLQKGVPKIRATRAAAPTVELDRFLAEIERWLRQLENAADEGGSGMREPPLPRLRIPPQVE
jgi:hypothetical protein